MSRTSTIVLSTVLLYSATVLAAAHAAPDRAKPDEAMSQKISGAQAILKSWRGETIPQKTKKLHVVYWTPSDREPAPRYRERLSGIMKDIQTYYGNEMKRLGFGRLEPNLDLAVDDLLKIHLVKSPRPYKDFSVKSGSHIRKECKPTLQKAGISIENETILIFANMSNWDPEKRTISQNSPYYASGTHRNGTAWQVDSPILDVASIPDKGNHVRDGQYGRMSLGAYNSMFIGGIAHELGHALGMPHIRERSTQKKVYGTALMGSGNRTYGQELRGEGKGSFLTLAHALRLAAHPLFTGINKNMTDRPAAKLEDVKIDAQPDHVILSGRIASRISCYAVIGYWDPEGRGDYDALSTVAIPKADGTFQIEMDGLPRKTKGEFRIVPLFVNGSASSFSYAPHNPFKFAFTLDNTRKPTLDCLHCKKKSN